MDTPELVKIIVSAAIAVIAVAGLWVAFLNFIFGRIDKRFEAIHHTLNERFDLFEKLLTARLDNYPNKEDIFELRTQIDDVRTQINDVSTQMSKENETLARKVDDMNAILIKHIEDSTLHSSRA